MTNHQTTAGPPLRESRPLAGVPGAVPFPSPASSFRAGERLRHRAFVLRIEPAEQSRRYALQSLSQEAHDGC